MVKIIPKIKNLKERREIKREQEKIGNIPEYGVTYGTFYGHPIAEEHGSGHILTRSGKLKEKDANLSLKEEDYAKALTSIFWAEENYTRATEIYEEDKKLREKYGNKDQNRLNRLDKLAKYCAEKAAELYKKGEQLYKEHKEALKKINPDVYREMIDSRYGSKVEDYVNRFNKDSKLKETYLKKAGLEKKVSSKETMIIALSSLIGGLFFLSSNITGNVIGNMTNSTSNWIGGVLFVLGLVGALFYFKNK